MELFLLLARHDPARCLAIIEQALTIAQAHPQFVETILNHFFPQKG